MIRNYIQLRAEEETGQVKLDFERTTPVKVWESYKLLAEYKLRNNSNRKDVNLEGRLCYR